MSNVLAFTISDEAMATLKREAQERDRTVEDLARSAVEEECLRVSGGHATQTFRAHRACAKCPDPSFCIVLNDCKLELHS